MMPVVEAWRRLKVEPGHVYIITPNKKMGISRGVLRVMTRDADRRLPSAVDFECTDMDVRYLRAVRCFEIKGGPAGKGTGGGRLMI